MVINIGINEMRKNKRDRRTFPKVDEEGKD